MKAYIKIKNFAIIFFVVVALNFSSCNSYSDNDLPLPDSTEYGNLTRYNDFFMELFNTLTVVVGYADSQEEFNYYRDIIFNELSRLHMLFDIYNEYPGINNIYTINKNAGIAPVEVDPVIIELIQVSKYAYYITNGTLNIALGPVLSLWHDHRNKEIPTLPSVESLLMANKYTNIEDIIIDEENHTIFLRYENMSLDVGSVGKGFAIDFAFQRAKEAGFEFFLLNVGGDVLTAKGPPTRGYWNVGVENPDIGAQDVIDVVLANNMAVFVSGDYQRFFVVDGVAYSHLIDPQTLMPATKFKSVTVLHPCALYAEILSVAAFIIDLESSFELLARHNAEALWVSNDNQIFTTSGYFEFSRDLS